MLSKKERVIMTVIEVILLIAVLVLTFIVLLNTNVDIEPITTNDNVPDVIPPVSEYSYYADNDVNNFKVGNLN